MAEETQKKQGNKTLGWTMVVIGGLLQIGWAIGLDFTHQFTDILWDLVTIAFLVASMVFLYRAIDYQIGFSTAYIAWMAVGVLGTIVVSVLMGLETITWLSAIFIAIMMAGVVGLRSS